MNTFALLVGLGASLGLLRILQTAPRLQVTQRLIDGLIILACALIGARITFVLLYGAYFSEHVLEIAAFWKGGLSWPGGMVGGLAAIIGLVWHHKIPFLEFVDQISQIIPPITISGWLGCWAVGIAFGHTLPSGDWLAIPTLDETGLYTPRFPLQLLAALSLLLFYAWLDRAQNIHPHHGQYFGLTLFGLACNLLITSFLRDDSAPLWQGLRPDTWAAIVFCLLTFCFVIWVVIRPRLIKFKNKSSFPGEILKS